MTPQPRNLRTVDRESHASCNGTPRQVTDTEDPGRELMIRWLAEQMRRRGVHEKRRRAWDMPQKLTAAEIEQVRKLRRRGFTLARIGSMFSRHPSTIAVICQ